MVADKAQRRSGKSIANVLPQSKPTSPIEDQALAYERAASKSCPVPLSLSALDQAISFFFTSRVNGPSESCKQVYKYLPNFYNADRRSALSHIMTAVGLAGLSSYRSAPALMSLACSHYSLALSSVGSALRDPMQAKTDQTLLTVHLLGVYEV